MRRFTSNRNDSSPLNIYRHLTNNLMSESLTADKEEALIKILKRALRSANLATRNGDVSYFNVLVEGCDEDCIDLLKKWARQNGLNLVDKLNLNTIVKDLDDDNSILLIRDIDELGRSVANQLLSIISQHQYHGDSMKGLLFVIATVTDSDKLDTAMLNRFASINMNQSLDESYYCHRLASMYPQQFKDTYHDVITECADHWKSLDIRNRITAKRDGDDFQIQFSGPTASFVWPESCILDKLYRMYDRGFSRDELLDDLISFHTLKDVTEPKANDFLLDEQFQAWLDDVFNEVIDSWESEDPDNRSIEAAIQFGVGSTIFHDKANNYYKSLDEVGVQECLHPFYTQFNFKGAVDELTSMLDSARKVYGDVNDDDAEFNDLVESIVDTRLRLIDNEDKNCDVNKQTMMCSHNIRKHYRENIKHISEKLRAKRNYVKRNEVGNFISTNANEGRQRRISEYRKYCNLDESAEITADNIDTWVFNKICVDFHCDPERFKCELLGRKWSDYENI